ncbi:DNA ligase [Paenibacillus polymyxa]|uniref:ATP-dependent DNA ligase n=1 Tax=Paenibacillus polymyxa TaxID=1406 RepID=UPI0039BD3ABB
MFVSPMLLEYTKDNKPFNDDNYITELKLDGIRLIVSNIDRPRLYTRHNNEITANFPELIASLSIPDGSVIDCELIVSDIDGKPNFAAVMERFKSNKSKHKVTACAFDIIKYKNKDITTLPLLERKELLDESFIENTHYTKSKFLVGKGIEYFNLVKQQGLEGTVQKLIGSKYEIGRRSSAWRKVIAYEVDEFFIAGYRKEDFGWLLSDGERVLGVMELGVGKPERQAGFKVFQQLKTKETNEMVYIQPLIKCIVKYRGYTKNNLLRLPVFERFVL